MGKSLVRLWGRFIAYLFRPGINRAKFFVDKFAEYLQPEDTLLDLGCGSGHLGLYANLYCRQLVTYVDVVPPWSYVGQWLLGVPCARTLSDQNKIPYIVYDGIKLPFPDGYFDTVLVAFVLHHAESPTQVLYEAARVARKQVIVFEDIPDSPQEAWTNRMVDALINIEFVNHPHNNRTKEQWEEAFRQLNLNLVFTDHWVSQNLGLSFPNTIFVLKKQIVLG